MCSLMVTHTRASLCHSYGVELHVQLFSSSNQDGLSLADASLCLVLSGGILSRGGTFPFAGGLFLGGILSCVGIVPFEDAVLPGGVVSRIWAAPPVDKSLCTLGLRPAGRVVGGVPCPVGFLRGGMVV